MANDKVTDNSLIVRRPKWFCGLNLNARNIPWVGDLGGLGNRDEFGQPGRRCSIPIDRFSTPPGGSYVGCMVAQGVSKDCIFNEDFRYVFKSAVGAVVYELR